MPSQSPSSAAIRILPVFSGLSEPDCEALIRNSRTRSLDKNEFLFMHGDKTSAFQVVIRGAVQLFRETPNGREMTSEILISGDTVCPEEVINGEPARQFNARAIEDSLVLEIPTSWMRSNLDNFDHLERHLLSIISRKLSEVRMENEQHATMNAPQILACFLQRLCLLYHFDPAGFTLPYSKTLIASRLGMEVETLSRTFRKLEEHGILVKGKKVSFVDLDSVERLSCHACSRKDDCPTHKAVKNSLDNNRSGINTERHRDIA